MERKILAIVPSILGNGGSAVNERQLLEHLCNRGRCHVISIVPLALIKDLPLHIRNFKRSHFKPSFILFLPVPFVPIALLLISIFLFPVIFLLDKIKKFDLIYIRPSLLSFGIIASNSLVKKTCVKLVTIYEDEIRSSPLAPTTILSIAERAVLSKVPTIATLSQLLLKRIAMKRRVMPTGKIVLVSAGIDKKKIETVKRFKIRLDRNYHLIGFVGTLFWWQGIDLLVRAVTKISGKFKVKLLIIGDGPERRKIEELCRKMKINCLITGHVRHEVALALLSNLDVLILPRLKISVTESVIPIKVIEAWALGVPVITTRHEIYDDIGLRDGKDVVFCQPDPDDVASKILMVLTDKELRRRLSERGPRIAEKYSYDKIAERILKAI